MDVRPSLGRTFMSHLRPKTSGLCGANITRFRIWALKRYVLNQLHSTSTASLCRVRSNELTATGH
jgi:hypothetical protein